MLQFLFSFIFFYFFSFYRVVVSALWPYLLGSRSLCKHCLDVIITVCGELNDNDDDSKYRIYVATIPRFRGKFVIIDKSLKHSKQCMKAARAGNAVLGMINRTFICKNKDLMLQLYKSLVRPIS